MKYLEREGLFRGYATEWSARTLSNGNVVINCTFDVDEMFIDGAWKRGQTAMVRGGFFPLKKTGAPNDKVVQMLCVHLGWGGSFQELTDKPPHNARVQVEVRSREHNGKTYYEANWIRGEDDDPEASGASPLPAEAAAKLDQDHGKALGSLAKKFAKAPTKPAAADQDIPF